MKKKTEEGIAHPFKDQNRKGGAPSLFSFTESTKMAPLNSCPALRKNRKGDPPAGSTGRKGKMKKKTEEGIAHPFKNKNRKGGAPSLFSFTESTKMAPLNSCPALRKNRKGDPPAI